MMPFSCAVSNASATCIAKSSNSSRLKVLPAHEDELGSFFRSQELMNMTPFKRSPLSLGFVLSCVFILTVPLASQSTQGCNSNDPGAPCFAGNPDILGGRGSLLQDDDLVVNTINLINVSTNPLTPNLVSAPAGANLLTTNSNITQTSPTNITSSNISLSNILTVPGRLFNVDHDQILSAALVENQGGQQSGMAFLEGSDSSIPVPTLSVLNNAQALYGTSGDFLGKGFDQMVVAAVHSGQLVLQALSAVDTTNPSAGLMAGPMSLPIASLSNVFAI